MNQETFGYLWVAASALIAGAESFLAYLMLSARRGCEDSFTKGLLKVLAICSITRAFEVCAATYRTLRIDSGSIPLDADAVGIIGRLAEFIVLAILIAFLLKPETRKALNGG